MNIFDSKSQQGSQFLRHLQKKIPLSELCLLSEASGFIDPNDYITPEEFKKVLKTCEFPQENHFEYLFALNETGYPYLQRYSVWVQLFLASLYVYCDKKKQPSPELNSDYHYLAITLSLDGVHKREIAILYLSFIEWLQDKVEPIWGYDDSVENYYCLLTWTFLRRITGTTDHACFKHVVDILVKKNYSASEINYLTDSFDIRIDAWYELHQKIPCPESVKRKFDQIIQGREYEKEEEKEGK